MKIGILTFHRAHNYGAFLQCYALQEYLKSLGHDVNVIDYDPKSLKRDYVLADFNGFKSLSTYKKMRKIAQNVVLFPPRFMRRRTFGHAINFWLHLGYKRFSGFDNINFSAYDAIFFGSDQIWNTKLTMGMDRLFWGDFEFTGKKIAYAASAGDDFSVVDNEKTTVLLKRFDAISVRENKLENFLKEKCNIALQTVLDPTLMLDSVSWCRFAAKRLYRENYVLLYNLLNSVEAKKIAENIASQKKWRLVEISGGFCRKPSQWKNGLYTPNEFVALFRDAAFVVTTSFHGTAFAINFSRNFCAVNTGKPNERIMSLLNMAGLQSRYIYNADALDLTEIDYLPVQESLGREREKSRGFVLQEINSCSNPCRGNA